MFSTWDIVRPRYWHPLASIEQSMMDLDDLADRMMRRHDAFFPLAPFSPSLSSMPFSPSLSQLSPFGPSSALFAAAPSSMMDDDDFFSDLPLGARRRQQQQQHLQQQPQQHEREPTAKARADVSGTTDTGKQDQDVEMQSAAAPSQPQQAPKQQQSSPEQQSQQGQQQQPAPEQRTFSTYSFSNSSIVDEKGRRIVSTRRRYEDSSGRLKAVHEREIEGKKLRSVWNRLHKGDAGKHETAICAGGGTPEEFEEAWKTTPFGEAQQQQQQRQLEQQKSSEQQKQSQSNEQPQEQPQEQQAAAAGIQQ